MEKLSFEVSRVVLSTQGRDAGRYFIVTEVLDEKHVMVADGSSHRLDHPKKKKTIHLKPKPLMMADLPVLRQERRLLDSDLRKYLEAEGLALKPLCKED